MNCRLLWFLVIGVPLWGQVTFDRIIHAANEPQNWLSHFGTYNGWRHSKLDQITPENVKQLGVQWVFQTRAAEKFEVTPLVTDGVMYITETPNNVFALDARTGRAFWEFDYAYSPASRLCCGLVNRGLAILGESVFMGTVDGFLLALDSKTGKLRWKTQVADYSKAYALVHAPLVVKDKVLAGPAGGEFGIRGFLAAYDARTGKEVWRFNTVPGPGEAGHETWGGESWKTGSAPIWTTGTYDPELNLIYWGTGNPGPDYNGDLRPGDNLYSSSVIALDADTGKLKWHYQFTPHDEWDWDASEVPVLVDMAWKGRMRKLLLLANRNGFYYTLDRVTGEFLQAKPFVKQTWNAGFDEKGRPVIAADARPTAEGRIVYPGQQGGTNWYNPSYSPRTGLFYIPAWVDYYTRYNKFDVEYVAGRQFTGGTAQSFVMGSSRDTRLINTRIDGGYGAVLAIDAATAKLVWEFKMGDVTDGGILTTASDLLFTGNRDQYFYALDARTGAMLWKMYLGGNIRSGPITYKVGDKQYVTVAAGSALFTFTLK